MRSIKLAQVVALGSAFALAGCQPSESAHSETEERFQALYNAEFGVALTESAQEQLEALGYVASTLEMVVDDEIYSLADENLPALTADQSYPLMVDNYEVGRIELIGSKSADLTKARGSWSCGPWRSYGCCRNGYQERRWCCFAQVDCYWAYRCINTGGPC